MYKMLHCLREILLSLTFSAALPLLSQALVTLLLIFKRFLRSGLKYLTLGDHQAVPLYWPENACFLSSVAVFKFSVRFSPPSLYFAHINVVAGFHPHFSNISLTT